MTETNRTSMYLRDLDRNAANYVPLTPVSFLERSARVWPERVAVIHGARRYSYAQLLERSRRLASALMRAGVERLDTVALLCPNTPEMLEAHYGIPMAGAVICAINTRLDSAAIAFILDHSESRVFLVDRELAPVAREALARCDSKPLVINIDDSEGPGGEPLGELDYESFLTNADPSDPLRLPEDEWYPIALGYTSGTTGNPKGVVTHHRGAYLNAMGATLEFGFRHESVYLWTLPMFHCNGWTLTWGVCLVGGTHVCLRKVEVHKVYASIAAHGVTNLCGAPVVLGMLIHAREDERVAFSQTVRVVTGGAAPPSAVIAQMHALGFEITHTYGLTEVYGPSTVCAWQPGIDAKPWEERAAFQSRQGVALPTLADWSVLDAEMQPVHADAETLGEVMLRGNTVMMGYLKNPAATEAAFRGGWFHTGDLAVMHPDQYIQIKDRSKDIIISGGENISSLEVEEALYKHPSVMEAAVVAQPDEKWGETPHAFVTLKPGGASSDEEIIEWCRQHLAHFKCPRYVTFGPLPKTSTGKIQKYALRQSLKR